MSVLLVLALSADTVTYLLLPLGAERNPLVLALGPITAIVVRGLSAGLLIGMSRSFPRWREALLLPGIVAGSIGFGANLSVLV